MSTAARYLRKLRIAYRLLTSSYRGILWVVVDRGTGRVLFASYRLTDAEAYYLSSTRVGQAEVASVDLAEVRS